MVKQKLIEQTEQTEQNKKQCCQNWNKCPFNKTIKCLEKIFQFIVPFILVFLIYSFLGPVCWQTDDESPINNQDLVYLNFTGNSKILIIDSEECSKYKYGACLKQKCQSELYKQKIQFNCEYQILLNQIIKFKKFVLNCESKDKCKVFFYSKNFYSENLFLYGYDIDIESYKIESRNIFYDSYLGTFKVENLVFDQALINTSFGDIAIETDESVLLTTITKEPFVCATCHQGWKDINTKISNLKEVFEENDKKQEECFVVYRYQNRDQQQMVMKQKHSVFDQLKVDELPNQDEIRCVEINDLILMNNNEIPSSIQNLKQIKASNYKGNIFVNILSNSTLQKPVVNTFFQNQNIKLSERSAKDLNSTVRQILDEGKTNEIVYLDFRQTLEPTQSFVYVLIFNAVYLHLTPAWLSSLSFSTLSSKDERKQMTLVPGLCPYIFSYDSSTYKQFSDILIENNEQLILEVIKSFFDKERVDVYLVTTWNDFQNIAIRDKSSYPDIENIGNKIQSIIITEVILVIIMFPLMLFIFSKILISLKDKQSQKQLKDKAKIIYYFFQFHTLKKKQQTKIQQNNHVLSQINSSLQEIQQKEEENINISSQSDQMNQQKNQRQNYIKLQCEISSNISVNDEINFFFLSQKARIWLLTRYVSSFELFLKSLLVIYDEEKYRQKKQTTQIDITQLKEGYQLFCFLFNLQEELILTEQLDNLMINSFKYEYKQIIVFKKMSDPLLLKQDEFLVQLESSKKREISNFVTKNKEKLPESMSFTEFMFHMDHPELLQNKEESKLEEKIPHTLRNTNVQQLHIQVEERKNQQTINISENVSIELPQISCVINKNNQNTMQNDLYYELATDIDDSIEDIYSDVDFYVYGDKTKVFAKTEEGEPDYILNKDFLESIQNLSGDFLQEFKFEDVDSKIPEVIEISKKIDNSQKDKNDMTKKEIDENYKSLLYKSRRKGQNKCIASFLQYIRTSFLNILYLLSPFFGQLLPMCFTIFFTNQSFKFDINSYFQLDYNFYYFGSSFQSLGSGGLVICCLIYIYSFIFIGVFYSYVYQRRDYPLFTEVRQNSFYGNLQIIKKYYQKQKFNEEKQENIKISNQNKKFYKFCVTFYITATLFTIMFQIVYISLAFVVLVFGSIIFPKIQLPVLIFFGSLMVVLIQMILNFNSAYQCGRQRLKKGFEDIFFFKFDKFIEQQRQNRPQKQKQQILKDVSYNRPQKQKYSILKDVSIHTNHTFQSVFDYLEGSTDRNLTEEELKDFLENIQMKLNQFQLNQLFSHLYMKEKKYIYFLKIWTLKKDINQRQFGLAMDFLIKRKVKMALYYLDISYPSLFLNLILIIFQSILIASVVYLVYYGLSSNDAVFDFGSNSIVSIGSVVGIIFSKKDKDLSKVFEDEDAIKSIIEKVQLNMHEFN